MIKRHTIVLDKDIESKLRNMQADQIKKTGASVSFSSVINQVLRKALK
jgi:hypothetical protein